MTYRLKHLCEYLALRLTGVLVNALPYRAALAVGWLNACLSFRVLRYRRAAAEARIREVFGARFSARQVSRIAWRSWRNIVFNGVELLRAPRMSAPWVRAVSDCAEAMQALRAHGDSGRGAVLAVPHMGNWELAAVTCHFHGIPIFSIAARQRNPLTDAHLRRLRAAHGMLTLTRGSGTMKDVLKRLRAGQVLAILPDVRLRTEGVRVPFLGAEANLGPGMALFARHAGVPIIPGLVTRRGWARHVLRTCPPIWPDKTLDKEADAVRMTAAVMKTIEAAIRAEPEQWFWFNRRWVLEPLEGQRSEAGGRRSETAENL